jgi:hypothetical protein
VTGLDHFLGPRGQGYDRLAVTVTTEADLLAFLEALLADDGTTDWHRRVEEYLDALLAWLRSDEGRQHMASFPSVFSAMAAALYAGVEPFIRDR